jgi:hypothetical protein
VFPARDGAPFSNQAFNARIKLAAIIFIEVSDYKHTIIYGLIVCPVSLISVGDPVGGVFQLKRLTRRDRMRARLRAIKEELQRRMHEPIPLQGKWQSYGDTSPIMLCRQTAKL